MESLILKLRASLPDGVELRDMTDRRPGLINLIGKGRELEPADMDAFRSTLTRLGFREAESWIATEGMSWLSDGIQSVSMIIREVEPA